MQLIQLNKMNIEKIESGLDRFLFFAVRAYGQPPVAVGRIEVSKISTAGGLGSLSLHGSALFYY